MRRALIALHVPTCLGLLLCSGCFGPYQSPYGAYPASPYGGYPPPGVPTQTLQPGGTYAPSPYMQPTPYGGQPVLPNATPSTGPTSQSSGIAPAGGDSPFYGSGSSSSAPPYDSGGVPTPHDPGEVQFQQPVQPDHTAIDSYGAVNPASVEVAGVAKVDVESAEFLTPVRRPAVAAALAQQTFADAQPTSVGVPEAPFAYDADYKWLRGVLRFDAASGRWVMIYSDNPASDDAYAGRLEVADAPELAPFKPQSVVLLRGSLDQSQAASTGRPLFRPTAVEPVELSVP